MITVDEYFTQEKKCIYKGEAYSVRNNVAVMRRARDGKVKRKLDEIWTFGVKNEKNAYIERFR